MERIIHYIEEYLEKVFTVHAYNITDLDATASALKEDSDKLSRNILEEIVSAMNIFLREDKDMRKEMGLVIKEKDRPRCILTELGEIKYKRDYYYNKNEESYETPLDQMLSVKQRARIGDAIVSKLVTKAAFESYEKSAQEVTNGVVSRQSVRNHILKTPELEKEPRSSEKKQARILEIYADEDHVHMQKSEKRRGKKNKMVPLVTVTEGTEKIGKRRNATIEAMHFVDEKMNIKDLWDSVEGYISKAYDIDSIEEIRLHSDGGQWIRGGLENFPNVVRAMDKWHVQERLRALAGRFPGQPVKPSIEEAIKREDRRGAAVIVQSIARLCETAEDFKTVQEFNTYLFSKWEAIVNAYREGMSGSCTEGLVSHVLSVRFSRNPMGWSEEGLGKLSKIRVYCLNGGEITAALYKEHDETHESYKEYARRYLEKQIGGYDYSWMSDMRETYVFDTTSGTQQAIRNLGRIRSDVLC